MPKSGHYSVRIEDENGQVTITSRLTWREASLIFDMIEDTLAECGWERQYEPEIEPEYLWVKDGNIFDMQIHWLGSNR